MDEDEVLAKQPKMVFDFFANGSEDKCRRGKAAPLSLASGKRGVLVRWPNSRSCGCLRDQSS